MRPFSRYAFAAVLALCAVPVVAQSRKPLGPDDFKVEIDLESHRVRIESGRETQAFKAALSDEGYAPAP